jgi:hypothetical protein
VVRGTRRFEAKSCGSRPGEGGRGTVRGRRYELSSDGTLTRVKVTSAVLVHDPGTRRALQFDTLAAVLPMERRDRLEQLLIDDDIATQKHLAQEGRREHALP